MDTIKRKTKKQKWKWGKLQDRVYKLFAGLRTCTHLSVLAYILGEESQLWQVPAGKSKSTQTRVIHPTSSPQMVQVVSTEDVLSNHSYNKYE